MVGDVVDGCAWEGLNSREGLGERLRGVRWRRRRGRDGCRL